MTTCSTPKSLLLLHSHYGELPSIFALALERGDAVIVRERDLTPDHFAAAKGLITTSHLDQIGMLAWVAELSAFLARGGRWFFNGHILRELVPGLKIYQPIAQAKRSDLDLVRLNDHPIFAGLDQRNFEESRGVAGFYGRGHNPRPEGAVAINGIGPERLPIDWEWPVSDKGRIFSHAGNDLGSMGDPDAATTIVTPRIVAWTAGELGA